MANIKRAQALQASKLDWIIESMQAIAQSSGVELQPVPTLYLTPTPMRGEDLEAIAAGQDATGPEVIDTSDGVDDTEASTAGRALQKRKPKSKAKE